MAISLEERAKLIEKRIPDRGMRDIIFGFPRSLSFLSNLRKYISYVQTTLYIVTLITYRKFVFYKTKLERMPATRRSHEIYGFSNAMVRLYNMFDGCYSSGRLDFGLVENVILNLQVDAAMNSGQGFLSKVGMQGYFNFAAIGNNLSKYIFSLKKSLLSTRDPIQFEFDDLLNFFNAFPFLRDVQLEYVDCPHTELPLRQIVLHIGNDTIDLSYLAVELNGQANYLYSVFLNDQRTATKDDPEKDQSIRAEYVAFGAAGDFEILFCDVPPKSVSSRALTIVYDTAVEDFLLRFRLLNVQNGKERNFFRDFFFVDNKYIKYLALTISDLINTESKRKVLEHFGKKYSSVFKQLNGAHIPRWDEIFVFLLLEVGIYRLLTYLFRNTNLDYASVKEALRLRVGETVSRLGEE